ncbi:MAG: magnesium-translocating P-type ATPase [Candidatus Methanofastidiosa archaeon]|nr:magnesium-translocating P-type ATPase [Candidatus Methanofastidiosa archaeon]
MKKEQQTNIHFNSILIESAYASSEQILSQMASSLNGLSEEMVSERQVEFGLNEVTQVKKTSFFKRIFNEIKNPLVLLLMVLALISYLTEDIRATIVILVMIILGISLQFIQELKADNAAERLKTMVHITTTVLRNGAKKEITLNQVVPGDIVYLSAGDMIPADLRILSEKDLFVNQSTLTGESIPVEKKPQSVPKEVNNPLEFTNICFMGSNVVSGSATAIVICTGKNTYFGAIAKNIISARIETSFDKGINKFTILMLRFIAVMVPLVFIINGLNKHDWLEAFLFATAVAVGLTPEMLPMIVTVNLSKGALSLSKKKVIVKRLNSIQNLGAMDVLCTDKTGTITEGKVVLEKHIDPRGKESDKVLEYAYLNSYFQTGLKNLMDIAILTHKSLENDIVISGFYKKIDEIPFDFQRRRMSVVVKDAQGQHWLICKGAVEEIMSLCINVELDDQIFPVLPEHNQHRRGRIKQLNSEGFRVIAVAYKKMPENEPAYTIEDESDMTLMGFLAFLDPPKASAKKALKELAEYHVSVKILTGDNDVVTSSICKSVGLEAEKIILGSQIEVMDDEELKNLIDSTTIFAKLSPVHKDRIIHALQQNGHVVGYMGDGINDALALKSSDVSISVDSGVDIAKESADIILLETSLLVIKDGVIEGRRIFGNIVKYIKMAASSNFGNMFSIIGASAFLPFVPMLPIQVLTNNLFYDFSQIAIPTDDVDVEWMEKPRKWMLSDIQRFIFVIGPISSIFDYLTFFLMLYVFNCWNNPELFHTGWFIESIFTQTLIIHVIRTNRIPFIQSRASKALTITSLSIVSAAVLLIYSPIASALGFTALPAVYWLFLAGMLLSYIVFTQVVKTWFYKKFED